MSVAEHAGKGWLPPPSSQTKFCSLSCFHKEAACSLVTCALVCFSTRTHSDWLMSSCWYTSWDNWSFSCLNWLISFNSWVEYSLYNDVCAGISKTSCCSWATKVLTKSSQKQTITLLYWSLTAGASPITWPLLLCLLIAWVLSSASGFRLSSQLVVPTREYTTWCMDNVRYAKAAQSPTLVKSQKLKGHVKPHFPCKTEIADIFLGSS